MRLFLVRWKHHYFYFSDRDGVPRRQMHTRLIVACESHEKACAYCDSIASGEIPLPDGLNPFIGFRSLRRGHSCVGVYRRDHESSPEEENFGLDSLTSLTDEELVAALDRMRIERPTLRQRSKAEREQHEKLVKRGGRNPCYPYDWDEWWESIAIALEPWQKFAVVKLLDRIKLFEIVETELES